MTTSTESPTRRLLAAGRLVLGLLFTVLGPGFPLPTDAMPDWVIAVGTVVAGTDQPPVVDLASTDHPTLVGPDLVLREQHHDGEQAAPEPAGGVVEATRSGDLPATSGSIRWRGPRPPGRRRPRRAAPGSP